MAIDPASAENKRKRIAEIIAVCVCPECGAPAGARCNTTNGIHRVRAMRASRPPRKASPTTTQGKRIKTMGYTTDFQGSFAVTPALTAAEVAYLTRFAETRRMRRDVAITAARPDPIREAVGLPVGEQGGYFVGASGDAGQEGGGSRKDALALGILDWNDPPAGQPGLWCQWVPSEDGTAIAWDEGEKFYNYVEWLKYIVANFLEPWAVKLNGAVSWQGEEPEDRGVIHAKDNAVRAVPAVIENPQPQW